MHFFKSKFFKKRISQFFDSFIHPALFRGTVTDFFRLHSFPADTVAPKTTARHPVLPDRGAYRRHGAVSTPPVPLPGPGSRRTFQKIVQIPLKITTLRPRGSGPCGGAAGLRVIFGGAPALRQSVRLSPYSFLRGRYFQHSTFFPFRGAGGPHLSAARPPLWQTCDAKKFKKKLDFQKLSVKLRLKATGAVGHGFRSGGLSGTVSSA